MWPEKEKVLLMVILAVLVPGTVASIDSNDLNNLEGKIHEDIEKVKNDVKKQERALQQLEKDLVNAIQKLNAQEERLSNIVEKLSAVQFTSNTKPDQETNAIEKGAAVIPHSTKGLSNQLYCIQNFNIRDCITIQHRVNGTVSFDRRWKKYKAGFGKAATEFWLGLQKIFETVQYGTHELLIVLEDFNGVVTYAHYSNFIIGNENESYALKSLGQYSGTAGDSMRPQEGAPFTLCDLHEPIQSNQPKPHHNQPHGPGWWIPEGSTDCKLGLNGKYSKIARTPNELGLKWKSSLEDDTAIKSTRMMVCPRGASIKPVSKLNILGGSKM